MRDVKLLVTGGSGFLGSHFVRLALRSAVASLTNVDLLTYAGDNDRLVDVQPQPAYRFRQADVADAAQIEQIFDETKPELVVHYAADSHVTRSESDPERFHRTNVEGTRVLLEASVRHGVSRFVHISTDEVYGSLEVGAFKEGDKKPGDEQASSAYAKSKAIGDDIALSFADRLEVVVARPTNAFGPWQFPEKAFPRWATRAFRGEPLLVWGDGKYVRQWLYAEDFASAIMLLAEKGTSGEAYNVGPLHDPEITNIELANWIAERVPGIEVRLTAYDRPMHDRRYAVDPSKITDLGWKPGDVWAQFTAALDWYRSNEAWWSKHIEEAESIYSDA